MSECEIANYLLQHKEGLEELIKKNVKEHSDLFPPSLYNIYLEQYKEAALQIIRDQLINYYTPEELSLIISEKFVIMVLGDCFLCP